MGAVAIWGKLRTLARLSPEARRAGLRALPALVGISLALRLAGFARTHRSLGRLHAPAANTPSSAEEVAAGVALAARALPWHPRCLERSLALIFLLRRRGLPARLRIGVRKAAGEGRQGVSPPAIEAHAWVEVAGRVVGDGADVHERFLAFEGDLRTAALSLAHTRR